jgi:prolyl-tRNA editing enzyme YbaK/EbsC (Cys-tRNA(Pro) deacylase)
VSGEEAVERSVKDALDRLGARYEILPCDPALADTALFCAHYGVDPSRSANTILVASRREPKKYAACLVLATTRLDVNRKVAELLGVRKVSFASADETLAVTGMMLGGVTPFGLPDLPIYVDARIPILDRVVVGGGSRSCKVLVDPDALTRLPGARVIDGLGVERTE